MLDPVHPPQAKQSLPPPLPTVMWPNGRPKAFLLLRTNNRGLDVWEDFIICPPIKRVFSIIITRVSPEWIMHSSKLTIYCKMERPVLPHCNWGWEGVKVITKLFNLNKLINWNQFLMIQQCFNTLKDMRNSVHGLETKGQIWKSGKIEKKRSENVNEATTNSELIGFQTVLIIGIFNLHSGFQ